MCPADCCGHCGDGSSKGLGNSQKGEVAWLQSQNVPIAHYGIEQFEELVKCAREQGDGAAAYWDQARLPSPSLLCCKKAVNAMPLITWRLARLVFKTRAITARACAASVEGGRLCQA